MGQDSSQATYHHTCTKVKVRCKRATPVEEVRNRRLLVRNWVTLAAKDKTK